jgi:hypothetical protein
MNAHEELDMWISISEISNRAGSNTTRAEQDYISKHIKEARQKIRDEKLKEK